MSGSSTQVAPVSSRHEVPDSLEDVGIVDDALPARSVVGLAEKQKEKLEALEHAGKDFEMEYLEMQNQLLLLAAGFDWSKGQVKDDEGNNSDYPLISP